MIEVKVKEEEEEEEGAGSTNSPCETPELSLGKGTPASDWNKEGFATGMAEES